MDQLGNSAGVLAMRTEDRAAPGGSGQIILIVEDDRPLRRMAGAQLRTLGYNVLEAEDVQNALQLLASGQKIDLLLTDIVMPGPMDGVELGGKALKVRPGLKIMYMSAYPKVRTGQGTYFDARVLLRKPFRRHEMAIKVRDALR